MQAADLVNAAVTYHQSLPDSPAEEYLASRGLMGESVRETVDKFRLGYVAAPRPGHEQFAGMLAIPYLRRAQDGGWSVVSLRFRCIEDHEHKGHGKYMTMPGDKPRMFNTLALLRPDDTVVITEGELDAIAAEACGVPAVGIPGATSWQPHFVEPFEGYRAVYILADGDTAGMKFATTVAATLPNAKIIPCPEGHDVNSLVIEHGPKAITERVKQ